MSNHTKDDAFIPEPDENVLMSALRNQDDIPILMDVVGESLSPKVSQEGHLSQALAQSVDTIKSHLSESEEPIAAVSSAAESVSPPPQDVSSQPTLSFDDAQLEQAIKKAFAKLLPNLIEEVMSELKKPTAP